MAKHKHWLCSVYYTLYNMSGRDAALVTARLAVIELLVDQHWPMHTSGQAHNAQEMLRCLGVREKGGWMGCQ